LKKYYIYENDTLRLIKETYIEKDALRYQRAGYLLRSRTKPIKKNAKANSNISRWTQKN